MGLQKPVNQAPQWLQDKVQVSQEKDQVSKSPGSRNSQAIAIYTILTILMRMKSNFGFEAMLEYIQKYLRMIEAHNPEIKNAVNETIKVINLHKIYKEVDNA